MQKRLLALTAIALITHSLTVMAGEVEKVRTFAEQKCQVTLPSSGFMWIDGTKAPHLLAMLRAEPGIVILVIAIKDSGQPTVNESYIKGFDKGFFESAEATKIKGEIIKFRGLSCYELQARLKQNNASMVNRVFSANGYSYQVQVIGNSLPLEKRSELEKYFLAFEFIGTPSLPSPKPLTDDQKAMSFSRRMGQLAAYCFIAIVFIVLFKKVTGKKDEDTKD